MSAFSRSCREILWEVISSPRVSPSTFVSGDPLLSVCQVVCCVLMWTIVEGVRYLGVSKLLRNCLVLEKIRMSTSVISTKSQSGEPEGDEDR